MTVVQAVCLWRAQWSGLGLTGHEERHILFLIFITNSNPEFPFQTLKREWAGWWAVSVWWQQCTLFILLTSWLSEMSGKLPGERSVQGKWNEVVYLSVSGKSETCPPGEVFCCLQGELCMLYRHQLTNPKGAGKTAGVEGKEGLRKHRWLTALKMGWCFEKQNFPNLPQLSDASNIEHRAFRAPTQKSVSKWLIWQTPKTPFSLLFPLQVWKMFRKISCLQDRGRKWWSATLPPRSEVYFSCFPVKPTNEPIPQTTHRSLVILLLKNKSNSACYFPVHRSWAQ